MNNPYSETLKEIADSHYMINMVSLRELLRLGFELKLGADSRVLDLCCGYGTLLKIWSEAFGIVGVGVDISEDFLTLGVQRIKEAGVDELVSLVRADVLEYRDETKYDVVIVSETFESIANSLALGARFLKPNGVLCYHTLYSKVDSPPAELVNFDGEILPLAQLNNVFIDCGYYLLSMASDTDADWERYVFGFAGRRNFERLKKEPQNGELRQWTAYWQRIYFSARRTYEGQALFALAKMV